MPLSMNPADRWAPSRWWLVGCIALAWCLRLPVALQNRFHPDEALYGYWGLLIGRGGDPWLSTVPVYKPPIFPYLMAASCWLFGSSEFALRYVGLAAGILMVPLGALLAHTLYAQRWVSTLTGFLVTLSPFAILFCGTAFPDPLMVALGMAACLSATRGHSVTAGLLAGLSFAVKQTGLV
ncbi:MAG: glycosyltransferase family 39 protein, partial [Anaerolineae bacterium]|nr:glycosyltransferase family 39 protein [Anaerolineae bacterium]